MRHVQSTGWCPKKGWGKQAPGPQVPRWLSSPPPPPPNQPPPTGLRWFICASAGLPYFIRGLQLTLPPNCVYSHKAQNYTRKSKKSPKVSLFLTPPPASGPLLGGIQIWKSAALLPPVAFPHWRDKREPLFMQ